MATDVYHGVRKVLFMNKNRNVKKDRSRPDLRAGYYSRFNPDYYRKKDGLRVELLMHNIDSEDDFSPAVKSVLYTDGQRTFCTSADYFYQKFIQKDVV